MTPWQAGAEGRPGCARSRPEASRRSGRPGSSEAWGRLPEFWLYGHASAIDWLADLAQRPGHAPGRKPTAVVTTSDTLTEPALGRIGRAFGCPVHSWYGSDEFNGFVAGTIPGTGRYAFNPLLVHVEVLDDRGRPTRPGELGRLVLTDLNNWVMPFVRYDTGDIAVRSAEGWHGGWPVVDRIEGRSSEVLRLPDGRVLSGVTVGAWVVKYGGGADRVRFFQAQQTAPDELELGVVWDGSPAPEERADIEGRLRDLAGPRVRTRLVDIEALETLPSGKAWVVRRTFD